MAETVNLVIEAKSSDSIPTWLKLQTDTRTYWMNYVLMEWGHVDEKIYLHHDARNMNMNTNHGLIDML